MYMHCKDVVYIVYAVGETLESVNINWSWLPLWTSLLLGYLDSDLFIIFFSCSFVMMW